MQKAVSLKDKKSFLVKCSVTASVKKNLYGVYIHLWYRRSIIWEIYMQDWGLWLLQVLFCCFYQLCEYIQWEHIHLYSVNVYSSVPNVKTCTDILQKWHVPSKSGNTGAILFSESTFIKADQQKEEYNCRKGPFVTGERYFCATPLFDWEVKSGKIEELSENLET